MQARARRRIGLTAATTAVLLASPATTGPVWASQARATAQRGLEVTTHVIGAGNPTVVTARVWPLGGIHQGEQQQPVAEVRGVTDTTGAATLVIPLSSTLLAMSAADDGLINVELAATSGTSSTTVEVVRPVLAGDLRAANLAGSARATAGLAQLGYAARYRTDASVPLTLQATGYHAGSSSVPTTDHCTRILVGSSQGVTTYLSELHTDVGMTGTFQYGQSADSDIDVGGSADGQSHWSIVGSYHLGTSRGQVSSQAIKNLTARQILGSFDYDKWLYDPVCGGPRYRSFVAGWDGNVFLGVTVPVANYCTGPPSAFTGGGMYHKYTGRNARSSTAVSVFGGTFGASSGWSTNSDLFYDLGSTGDRNTYLLCSHVAGVTVPNAATLYADTIFG